MALKRSDEFRREAVRIALTSGLTRKQVASDLGVGFSTLSKWIQKSRPGDMPSAPDLDLAKENDRLRKENRLLKEERDLLKKLSRVLARLCAVETACAMVRRWRVATVSLLEGSYPVKKRGPWVHANLRVVTLLCGDPG